MSEAAIFQRLREAFWRACDLHGVDRIRYLDEVGRKDAALRVEVEALIAHHEHGASGLDQSPLDTPLEHQVAVPALAAGTMLGSYRLVRFLAEGGMGAVYLAEQDSPRRTVALKVLKPGATTPSLMHRFVLEAEVLGRLHHPGIAQIYDAGRAGDQAYFALEFVSGSDLIRYAQDRAASDRERLELIAQVADAVQHAHRRGVIHRDLKPSNVLVDETGQPKVLDFGVARVTDRDGVLRSFATGVGQIVGTLPYMSPEQVSGDPLEVDTRTDVYALGAMLYELLSARRPLNLEGRSIADALRAIAVEEPVPLANLRPELDADVGTIVHHALNKERTLRYESAAAFADDVRRYLRNLPIAACPLTLAYQLSRFVRRNRALVVSSLVAAGVVAAAGVAVSFFAWYEHRANQRNEHLLDYLFEEVLAVPDPWRGGARDVELADVLTRAEDRLDEFFPGEPEVRARILESMGATLHHLGRYGDADRVFRRAEAAATQGLGPYHEDTLNIRNLRIVTLQALGRDADAETEARAVLERAEAHIGAETPLALNVLNNLALCAKNLGRHQEALELYRVCVERKRRCFGPDSDETLATRGNLAYLLQQMGRPREAVPELRGVLDGYQRLYGPRHPETLISKDILGTTLLSVGEFEEAERLIRESHEGLREKLGDRHDDTLAAEYHLAQILAARQRYGEAIEHFKRVHGELVATLGEAHPRTIQLALQQASAHLEFGQIDAGEQLITAAVAHTDGPDFAHLPLRVAVLFQGARLQVKRDGAEAREWFTRTLDLAIEIFGPDSPHTAHVMAEYGAWCGAHGEVEHARKLLERSPGILENAYGVDDRRARRAREAAEQVRTP